MTDPETNPYRLDDIGDSSLSLRHDNDLLFGETRLDRYLARRVRLAIWQFRLEGLLPVLATALLPLFAFIGIGFLGFWSRLPMALHAIFLVAAFLTPIIIFWRLRRHASPVRQEKAERELERRAGLRHSPLQAHKDHLSSHPNDDREVIQLWTEHHITLRKKLENLPWPHWQIGWTRYDPVLLSVPVILLVFVGFMHAGSAWQQRLVSALTINLHIQKPLPVAIEGWIDPPEYTGRSPIYLGQSTETDKDKIARIDVPENSRLVLRLDRSGEQPFLKGTGLMQPFEQDGQTWWKLERDMDRGDLMQVIVDEQIVAAWDFDILIDRKPLIRFSELPRITQRKILRIRYDGRDDYGIQQAWLLLRKGNQSRNSEKFTLQPISWTKANTTRTTDNVVYRLPITLPSPGSTEIVGNAWFDLTDHAWAGQEVDLVLEVMDSGGKTGRSRSLRTLLPQKQFSQPMAKQIIELRKMLFGSTNLRDAVADGLFALRRDPAYQDQDFTTQMALAIGERRLRAPNEGVTGNEAMAKLLWQTALWLEEGAQAKMRQKIAELQKKLREALNTAAMDEELAKILDELDRTWRKMQADRERAMADLPDELKAMLEQGDLSAGQFQRLMEELRRLNDLGDVEAMKEMLAHLQDLTNMTGDDNALQNRDRKDVAQILEQIKQLRELAQQQQDLMDDTLRADQYPGTETRRRHTNELIPEQEDLLKRLRDVREAIRKIAGAEMESLPRADKAMQEALKDMDAADPGKALDDQAEALKALSAGSENLSTMLTMPAGGMTGNNQQPRDPLGRGGNRNTPQGTRSGTGSNDPIPAERSLRESREIQQELHRRLDDPNRADQEIDYLERLLDRF